MRLFPAVIPWMLAALIVAAAPVHGEEPPSAPTVTLRPSFAPGGATGGADLDKLSYAVGVQFARSLQLDKVKLNLDVFTTALGDVTEGRPLQMSEAEVAHIVQAFQQRLQAQLQAERDVAGRQQLASGRAFLAEYAQRDGVTTLPSGVMYRVMREGDGPSPGPMAGITCHYQGALIDGTVFDSSYTRGQPMQFRVNQVIPGWKEALQLMPEGAKWELVIPSEHAYGPRGTGRTIPPNAVLIFEVELLHVESAAPASAPTTQ